MTAHEYYQRRRSLGYTPITNRPVYGTTGHCSCGKWEHRNNETPTGKGGRYAKDAFAAHVNEAAGPITKVSSRWEWTCPTGEVHPFRTKRDAVAAREAWEQ